PWRILPEARSEERCVLEVHERRATKPRAKSARSHLIDSAVRIARRTACRGVARLAHGTHHGPRRAPGRTPLGAQRASRNLCRPSLACNGGSRRDTHFTDKG